jgi:hypothetical protein
MYLYVYKLRSCLHVGPPRLDNLYITFLELVPYTDPELSAHENGLLIAPVAYDLLMLTAAAHVPVTMIKRPATIKKTLSATSAR